MDNYQEIFYQYNPQFHDTIIPLMCLAPEYRPVETSGKMRGEKQNPWRIIVEELSGLMIYPEEEKLLESLSNHDYERIEEYMKNNSAIPKLFFDKYPLLTFFLFHLVPEDLIIPLFLSYERMDLIPEHIKFTEKHIRYVRNEKILDYIYKRNPNIGEQVMIRDMVKYPGLLSLCIKTKSHILSGLISGVPLYGTYETIDRIRNLPESRCFLYEDLRYAIVSNNIEAVDYILSSEDSHNILFSHFLLQKDFIEYVFENGNMECLIRIINDPRIKKEDVLQVAITNNKIEIIELLG